MSSFREGRGLPVSQAFEIMDSDRSTIADFNCKMAGLTAQAGRIIPLEHELDRLSKQRIRLAGQAIKQRRKLKREKTDVRRLEKGGIIGWLRLLFGGGDRRLQREKREVDEARRDAEAAREALAPVDDRIRTVRAELEELAAIREEYAALIAGKEAAIAEQGGPDAEKLAKLVAEDEAARANFELVKKCFEKAATVMTCLARAHDAIRKARGYGRSELLLDDGGLYWWSEKNDAMHTARVNIARARVALQTIRSLVGEGHDGLRISQLTLKPSPVLFDALFDNIFVDLLVLKRLKSMQETIRTARRSFQPMMGALKKSRKETAVALQRTHLARRRFVEALE